MTATTRLSCSSCGACDVRLDENGDCERCWINRGATAQIFQDLEEIVKAALETGCLTGAQLHEALRMSVGDSEGFLLGTGYRREPVDTLERGTWYQPPSLFEEPDDAPRRRNQIRLLRSISGLSLEALAEQIDVSVRDVALWEQDVLPPENAIDALSELFAVSPAHLLGVDDSEEVA